MYDFVTYLSGNKNLFRAPYSLAVKPETALMENMRALLGTNNKAACIALYRICAAQPLYAQELNLQPSNYTCEGEGLDLIGPNDVVLGTGAGPARILPSEAPIVGKSLYMGPVYLTAETATTATLSYGDKKTTVPVAIAGRAVTGNWPSELRLEGAILLPENTPWEPKITTIEVPVRWRYPVQKIAKLLREENFVFMFLEECGMLELFAAADTDEECISIAVMAVIKSAKK